VETAFNTTKRGRHPLGDDLSPTPAATPPSLKRARHDSESSSPLAASDQDMEAPLGVALSQSMDSVNTNNGEEEVRTLFVSGLPMDAKPRELYLLFRAYEGYEGSLLKVTSKNGKTASPVGFVTFNTRAGAEAAKQDLQVGLSIQMYLCFNS
jgi:ATP-dependent Zn protease